MLIDARLLIRRPLEEAVPALYVRVLRTACILYAVYLMLNSVLSTLLTPHSSWIINNKSVDSGSKSSEGSELRADKKGSSYTSSTAL